MQLFAEQGLIGLIFYIIFYFMLLFHSLKIFHRKFVLGRSENNDFERVGPIIFLISFLLPIIPNMSFYNHWNNIFLFLVIGLMLNISKKNNINKNQ